MAFTKEQILALDDLDKVSITIPEWGGTFLVSVMSGNERDKFEAAHIKNPGVDFRARMVVSTLCHEDGTKVFEDKDVALVSAKSAKVLDRVFTAAIEVNKVSKQDIEELAEKS
jgi:hypothetical protein